VNPDFSAPVKDAAMSSKIATVLHEHRIVGDATNRFGICLAPAEDHRGRALHYLYCDLARDAGGKL
jgi:hypothetical protein